MVKWDTIEQGQERHALQHVQGRKGALAEQPAHSRRVAWEAFRRVAGPASLRGAGQTSREAPHKRQMARSLLSLSSGKGSKLARRASGR